MKIGFAAVVGVLALVLAVAPSASGSQSPTAVKAPVQVVRVSWGSIGYRAVGQGRPLVLLAGFAGCIDNWSPALIDRLARGARVYAMDYEGVGRSSLRPGEMTITRLANDTADFIRALHLEPADVMGWSMGSWVAQSLAIRHPTLVRRLVLAATALGDGSGTLRTNVTAPSGWSTNYPDAVIFPFNPAGRAAAIEYDHSIHTYPGFAREATIPPAVAAGQSNASQAWIQGLVPEGRAAATIRAPILVGDGGKDAVLPLPDSTDAEKAFPNASLKLYPNAAHGFLFQDEADWTRLVLHFLN